MSISEPQLPAAITGKSAFRTKLAPELALTADESAEFRVYLLKCAPKITGGPFCWYVGITQRLRIAQRMREHFAGKGGDFTAAHRPISIELLLPAINKAAEAYLFFAMVAQLPQTAVVDGRLGGWTQTRPKPSQLSQLLLREGKRMMESKCLACGASDHTAAACTAEWPDSASLTCGNCQATLRVTALGATKTTGPPRQTAKASAGGTATATAAAAKAKRPRDAGAETPPAPKAARTDACARVLLCGRKYTTLEWFLGRGATPAERRKALEKCGDRAVQLAAGNHNTLLSAGFAKAPPLKCKELWPERVNYPSVFTDTACRPIRWPGKAVQARLEKNPKALKNILLPLGDLEEHLPR